MISGLEPVEAKNLILSVGTRNPRRKLSPIEVSHYLQRAIDGGETPERLAEKCQLKSASIIGKFRKLLKLSPELSHLVSFGSDPESLSFTQAMELTSISDHEMQKKFALEILEKSINKDEVRAICQGLKKSDISLENSIERILKLRTQVIRSRVIIGTIRTLTTQAELNNKTQPVRDEIFREALNVHGIPGNGHLGTERFTIVVDESDDTKYKVDEIEEKVNDFLESYKF